MPDLYVYLPILISAVFFGTDIVWAVVYCAIIVLKTFNMTGVISEEGLPVLYIVAFVCILQIYASFRTRGFRPYPLTIRITRFFIGLFRLPFNFIFVRELLMELERWDILPALPPSPAWQPPIAKITDSVEIMMLATILLSVMLQVLHFMLAHRYRTRGE